MSKIPGNKDKASLEDWMVRISFAEAGEAEQTTHEIGAEKALDRVQVVTVLDAGNNRVLAEAPSVRSPSPEPFEVCIGSESLG